MKIKCVERKLLLLLFGIAALAHPFAAPAEDIDIFVAGAGGSSVANVLIVLDNTSNWSQQSQKWPGGVAQGQAELLAIKNVVGSLNDSVNVGLMLFTDNGSGNCCNAGYIRYAMRPMNPTNRTNLQALLQNIYDNFSTPGEKVSSSANYSAALFDAFKYFGGYTSPLHARDNVAGNPIHAKAFGKPVFASPPSAFPASHADPKGYTDLTLTNYLPPAAAAQACGGQNFTIFIGNGFPNVDTAPAQNMKTFLEDVGGDSSQIPMPVLTTTTSTAYTNLGTSACFNNNAAGLSSCSTAVAGTCGANYDTCTCAAPTTGTGCTGGKVIYTIQGGVTTTTVTPTGTTALPAANKARYPDEWARFLYLTDVNDAVGQQNVTTYTIDVFNAKQDADQTALLYNMASAGGGKYFPAKSQAQIETALGSIFAEIQAVNSTFASASLPVSATNRTLNVNEVYMGIFRPDPAAKPLWFGNLKRYKLANFNGDYKLADVTGLDAVNTVTGFITDCAASWWTNDSGKFWKNVTMNPSPAGTCPPGNPLLDPFSDRQDGPKVEKGGSAEILRQGNVVLGSPTWALNRTTYTKSFVPFDTTNSGMTAPDVNFINGLNVDALGNSTSYTFVDPLGTPQITSVRPTIHGGVVHSRPLPVNYGIGKATVLYYGADDGTFRAVDSATGRELWAYVAEEFYPTLPRLRQNSPQIKYSFTTSGSVTPAPQPKDYHFDGSSGIYQSADSAKIWIFSTMRRGGRMIYAFDVSDPTKPSLKWKVGCPHLLDDNGCTPGFTGIGQTWSTPNVAPVNVGGTVRTVLIVGGGYDNCEDGAAASVSCAKGSVIYVINAVDGSIVKSFTTSGRVAGDVALIDVDYDGIADYAYAADTRGNLYRITFGPSKTAPLAVINWKSTLIAQTTAGNRKFLETPALVQGFDKSTGKTIVYVALGSGDREQPLETQYPYATPVKNRFYVFMDNVASTTTADLDNATTMNNFTSDTTCGTAVVIPGSGKSGWFMDLPNRGEQVVTSAVVAGGLVAFSTNRAVPASAGVCAPLGEARGYAVNLFNASGAIAANNDTCGGQRSSVFAGGGLPPSPIVANVDIDGKVQTIVIGVANLQGNASSAIQSAIGFTLKPQRRTRIYWRQEGDN